MFGMTRSGRWGRTEYMTIAVCAIGVAVAALAFAALSSVLLRPLPYAAPERIVRVTTRGDDAIANRPLSLPLAQAVAAGTAELDALAVADEWDPTLTVGGESHYVIGGSVSSAYFSVFGVTPALGRFFDAMDDAPGHEPVVVVTHALWQQRLSGRADAIGQKLTLNGIDYRLVGVLPRDWEDPRLVDGIAPPAVFRASPNYFNEASRDGFSFSVVARVRDGIGIGAAQAAVQAVASGESQMHPADYAGRVDMALVPLVDAIAGASGNALRFGFLAALAVWLIAVANAANLLLLGAFERGRRLALCRALGATDARLFAQLLRRQCGLALLGGAAGIGMALGAVAALRASGLVQLVPRLDDLHIDAAAATFALALSALLGAVSATIAGVSVLRAPIAVTAALASRGDIGTRARGRRAIVALQLGMATLLVSVSLLLWSGYRHITRTDLGIRADDVAAIELRVGVQDWPDAARLATFWRTLLERAEAMPGVEAAGIASIVPLAEDFSCDEVTVPGRATQLGVPSDCAETRIVSGGYFAAVNQGLRQGRAFSDNIDRDGAQRTVMLSRSAAQRFFPTSEALGSTLRLHGEDRLVVGIVDDVRHFGPAHAAPPMAYLPLQQQADVKATLLLRGTAATLPRPEDIEAVAQQLSSGASLVRALPLASLLEDHVAGPRSAAIVLSAFTLAGALLALVGLFSVVDWFVVRRRGEFALRLAVGARAGDLGRLVMRDALRLAVLGGGAGALAAFVAAPVLVRLIPGVDAVSPAAPLLALLAVAVAAVLFALAPARRASRIAPARALAGD